MNIRQKLRVPRYGGMAGRSLNDTRVWQQVNAAVAGNAAPL